MVMGKQTLYAAVKNYWLLTDNQINVSGTRKPIRMNLITNNRVYNCEICAVLVQLKNNLVS